MNLLSISKVVYRDLLSEIKNVSATYTYGPFCSLAAMRNLGVGTRLEYTLIERKCSELDNNKEYPWEFIHWSILESGLTYHDIEKLKYEFKGTRVLNWRLLAIFSKLFYGNKLEKIIQVIWLRILIFTHVRTNGLIQDRILTSSSQYHIFSCFLLCRMREKFGYQFLDSVIENAFEYIVRNKIGDKIYLWRGRGQQQIFGYAALLYVADYVGGSKGKKCMNDVLNLIREKYETRSRLPLVITNDHEFAQSDKVGWYGYNNYVDYKATLLLILSLIIEKNKCSVL